MKSLVLIMSLMFVGCSVCINPGDAGIDSGVEDSGIDWCADRDLETCDYEYLNCVHAVFRRHPEEVHTICRPVKGACLDRFQRECI